MNRRAEDIKKLLGKLRDKLAFLENKKADESDPKREFQLKNDIDETRAEIAKFEAELAQLTGAPLAPAPVLSPSPKLGNQANVNNAEGGDVRPSFPGVRETQGTKAKKDFFVSYTEVDNQWAKWIAWELEAAGYGVVIQAWDFRPGGNFVLEMQKAAAEYERTLAVLSQAFLDKAYTQPEWAAAFAQDPTGEKRTLVFAKVADCKLEGLLKAIIHINLMGKNEDETRNVLLEGVKPGRAKPSRPPSFPGGVRSSPKPIFPREKPRLTELQNFVNSIGMEFVLVTAGSFLMGSSDDDVHEAFANTKAYNKDIKFGQVTFENLEWHTRERPQHRVTFAQPFYMGKYPVTQGEWKVVMDDNPSHFKGDNLPVEMVSWDDCQEFIKRLNAKNDGYVYRLPSEAEWEYACRAGTTTPFYFGDAITSAQVNYNGNYPFFFGAQKGEFRNKTTPVGSFPPNAWGLYDMHGNVWEWCQDRYHENYYGAPNDGSAWEQGSDDRRALRGGSLDIDANSCRSAFRDYATPINRSGNLGFRLVAIKII